MGRKRKNQTPAAQRLECFENLITEVGKDLIQKAYHACTKLTESEIDGIKKDLVRSTFWC